MDLRGPNSEIYCEIPPLFSRAFHGAKVKKISELELECTTSNFQSSMLLPVPHFLLPFPQKGEFPPIAYLGLLRYLW